MILVIDGGTTPTKLACSRRSDSGEYFLSLSLLRTALHYLNAWNRLQPNERDLWPTETLTYFYNKLRNYSANFLTKNRWFSKNWQTWYFNWHPFATETAQKLHILCCTYPCNYKAYPLPGYTARPACVPNCQMNFNGRRQNGDTIEHDYF